MFSEAQVWTGADKQSDIWNRIIRKVWENSPSDNRPEISETARKAGGLDVLWIEEIPDIAWNSFTMWITSHVRNFDEFALHFRDTNTEAIRWRGDNFATAQWEVLLGHFETSGWNTLQFNWTSNERLNTIMRATAERVISGAEEAIGRTWERRITQPPQAEQPTIGVAPDTSVPQPVQSPIENLRPSRQAHFKADADRELFSDYDPQYRIMKQKEWWDKDITFMVFDFAPAPPGFVLVSGANYNTYAAIRSAKTYQYDPGQVVRIRKPRREEGDVLPTTGFFSKFPPDKDLNSRELKAVHDIGQEGVRFVVYPDTPSDPDMGEVQYWYEGPNIRAVGLVNKNAIE